MAEGWYVNFLLRNRDSIRSSIISESNDLLMFNLEDDLYNDLLSVETSLSSLIKDNRFSKKELSIIDLYIIKTYRVTEVIKELKISRASLDILLDSVCTKIAFSLGGHFTNHGFLEFLKENYDFTEKQINRARSILNIDE